MQNFVEINQTVGFYKFEILSADKVIRVTLRYRTKFRGDMSNRCLVTAIYRFFQNGGYPPSWILKTGIFNCSIGGHSGRRNCREDNGETALANT